MRTDRTVKQAATPAGIDEALRLSSDVPVKKSAKTHRLYSLNQSSDSYTICEAYHDMQQFNYFREIQYYNKTLPPLVLCEDQLCLQTGVQQSSNLENEIANETTVVSMPTSCDVESEYNNLPESSPFVHSANDTGTINVDETSRGVQVINDEYAADVLDNAKADNEEVYSSETDENGREKIHSNSVSVSPKYNAKRRSSAKSNPELAIKEPIVAISEHTKQNGRRIRKQTHSLSPELPPGPISAKRRSLERIRAKEQKRRQEQLSLQDDKINYRSNSKGSTRKRTEQAHLQESQPFLPPQFISADPLHRIPPQSHYKTPHFNQTTPAPQTVYPMPKLHPSASQSPMYIYPHVPSAMSASTVLTPYEPPGPMISTSCSRSPQPTMTAIGTNDTDRLSYMSPTYSSTSSQSEKRVDPRSHVEQYATSNDSFGKSILPAKRFWREDSNDIYHTDYQMFGQSLNSPQPLRITQDSMDPRQKLVQPKAADSNISVARTKDNYRTSEQQQSDITQPVYSGPHYQPEKYSIKPVLQFRDAFFTPERYSDIEGDEEHNLDIDDDSDQQHRRKSKKSRYFIPNLHRFFQAALEDGNYFESYDHYDPSDIVNFRHSYQPQQYHQLNSVLPEGSCRYAQSHRCDSSCRQQVPVCIDSVEKTVCNSATSVPLPTSFQHQQSTMCSYKEIKMEKDDSGIRQLSAESDSEGSDYSDHSDSKHRREANTLKHKATPAPSQPQPKAPVQHKRGRPRKYPLPTDTSAKKTYQKQTKMSKKKNHNLTAIVKPHDSRITDIKKSNEDGIDLEEDPVDAHESLNRNRSLNSKSVVDNHGAQQTTLKGKQREQASEKSTKGAASPTWSRAGSVEAFNETYELVSDDDTPPPSSGVRKPKQVSMMPAFAPSGESQSTNSVRSKNQQEIVSKSKLKHDSHPITFPSKQQETVSLSELNYYIYQHALNYALDEENTSKGKLTNHPIESSIARRGRKFRRTYTNSHLSKTDASLKDYSSSNSSSRSGSVFSSATQNMDKASSSPEKKRKKNKPTHELNLVVPSKSLICTVCGQHALPQSTWDAYKFPEGYLQRLEETQYERKPGHTGKGSTWDPRVFIQCEKCKVKLHCGCTLPPVKGYPMRYRIFMCTACQEKEHQGKQIPTIPAGSKVSIQNITKGSRRAAAQRISYKV